MARGLHAGHHHVEATQGDSVLRARNIHSEISSNSHPGGSVVKNPPANAGGLSSIPGSGRSPGEGNGNPLQYSCLENPMDGEAW